MSALNMYSGELQRRFIRQNVLARTSRALYPDYKAKLTSNRRCSLRLPGSRFSPLFTNLALNYEPFLLQVLYQTFGMKLTCKDV